MNIMGIIILLLTFSVVNCHPGRLAKSRRRSQQGCEGTVLQLNCEDGLVISPVRANYGRFSRSVCNAESYPDWSTRCIQPTSLRVVSGLCAGMTSCSLDVTSNVFGDPCPGTYKYLEVHYMCVKKEEKEGLELPAKRDFLPPWLMKMSATTSKTPITTEAVTTSPLPLITEVEIETFYPEADDKDTESIVYEDVIMPMHAIDNNEEARNDIYINLPYRRSEWDTVEAVEVDSNGSKTLDAEGERTLLVVTLVSLSVCSTVIILTAILYTRYRKNKSKTSHLSLPSISKEYQQHLSKPYGEYYESSDSSTTSTSTHYTTLPNGQQAIVIPITASSSLFNQNLTLGHDQSVISWVIGDKLSQPLHSLENIYMDIDANHL